MPSWHTIISVSLKPDDRKFPFHPHVECIVQEQIRQQRTNDAPLRRTFIPYSASPIVDMASNKHNFLLKNKNGSIVDSSVSNAAHVACAADSYAALIKNGTVETWGNTYGSWTNNNQGGQKAIYATGRAFASLTDNDNIILWGEGSGGGSDPFITSALAGKISYYRK